ncbi:MAG: 3-deoxy-D-manno-octulosonic acid transferase, partial [Candidatus Electrothrix sp. EH2]|nr:3-deoxy-D-manno-octulosonic acid transferase [Candidatus Electrothrix sp. EH2]
MFCSFDVLSMQTEEDCHKMTLLGLSSDKVAALGNLKYDMEGPCFEEADLILSGAEAEEKIVWVCGSTHPGEEKILLAAYAQLLARRSLSKQLELVLAPRDINRSRELVDLAGRFCLEAATRSSGEKKGRVLILDTLGELAHCY